MTINRTESILKTIVVSVMICGLITLLTGIGPNMKIIRSSSMRLKQIINPNICNRTTAYSPIPLPRVMLRSFPGSGNTWTRFMLQLATGQSIYAYK